MRLIKIEKLENGAHCNQTIDCVVNVPKGWAVIPDDMVCENFPFGEVTAEEIDGVMTVTNWVAGEIPEPEAVPEPESVPDTDDITWDALAEAYSEGVNSIDE